MTDTEAILVLNGVVKKLVARTDDAAVQIIALQSICHALLKGHPDPEAVADALSENAKHLASSPTLL